MAVHRPIHPDDVSQITVRGVLLPRADYPAVITSFNEANFLQKVRAVRVPPTSAVEITLHDGTVYSLSARANEVGVEKRRPPKTVAYRVMSQPLARLLSDESPRDLSRG